MSIYLFVFSIVKCLLQNIYASSNWPTAAPAAVNMASKYVRPTNQNGKTYNACVQNTTTANSFCGKQQFIKTHKNPF